MIHIDEKRTEIRGAGADVLSDLTVVMHHLIDAGIDLKRLHGCVDLAAMSKEEVQREADRLRGIHQMVSDAFDAARKD